MLYHLFTVPVIGMVTPGMNKKVLRESMKTSGFTDEAVLDGDLVALGNFLSRSDVSDSKVQCVYISHFILCVQ